MQLEIDLYVCSIFVENLYSTNVAIYGFYSILDYFLSHSFALVCQRVYEWTNISLVTLCNKVSFDNIS